MASARQVLIIFSFSLQVLIISILLQIPYFAASTKNISLPNCPERCGNMAIPYPFGTLPGCYRAGFNLTCNDSTTPPKVILGANINVLDINIITAEARVLNTIGYTCYNLTSLVNISNSSIGMRELKPFLFSNRRNKFTVIGCYSLGYITGLQGNNSYLSGCVSYCNSLNSTTGDGGSCNGLGCCQTSIPKGVHSYKVQWGFKQNNASWFSPCSYAVMVQEDWYNFTVHDLEGFGFYERNKNKVPIVLDWAIRDNGTCQGSVEKSPNPACLSNNSRCDNTLNGEGYICKCSKGYEGNPYLPDGCKDIDECQLPHEYPCNGTCSNTIGDYECACPEGKEGNATIGHCTKIPENFPYPARVAISCIVGVAIFLGLCFLVATYQQHKRHIKENKEFQRYYNLMDNHLRVFSKKQIEVATDNFAETRVLGRGGQGDVYKGLIENNQVVAIKKAKKIEETQREEFVNEILLLSQINHKNIVRLLGCCLEVKIPILVYEFVPSGTLSELLHAKSNRRPISVGTRLKIALESAEAIDYLHCSMSQTILHGDVKSANILLEVDYSVKVSDFGASNLVPNDDSQVVKVVQGTRGYIDPEYFATAVLTKKSDVYSYGVVLLELITRKCHIFTDETHKRKHLASCFVSKVSKNQLHELLDEDILSNNDKVIEILREVSELAVWCLSVRGEDRPTMRQVVEKLQIVVRLYSRLLGTERVEEEITSENSRSLGASTSYTASDSCAFHDTGYNSVLEIETEVPS